VGESSSLPNQQSTSSHPVFITLQLMKMGVFQHFHTFCLL